MKLGELSPQVGSRKEARRLGRGIGSGLGKTSGKGHKGQNARSGGGVRPGFEGGQMPLIRRIPKRGFKNMFRKEFSVVNVSDLSVFEANTIITAELLLEKNLINKIEKNGVKILGNGNIEKAFTVKANKFSESAKAKIEAVGGTIEVI